MKIRLKVMIACLAASVLLVVLCSGSEDVQNVGGDFGRAWLTDNQAPNPAPAPLTTARDNSTNATLTGWGGLPKGEADVEGDLATEQNSANQQKASNPLPNWLGDSSFFGAESLPTTRVVTQPQPFFISTSLKPVHQIDSSFNQTIGSPVPDANGLINGWDADAYYAIGPALDSF